MSTLSRWLAPVVLAAGFGMTALAPAPAHAQDDALVRVIVDVADVIFRSGTPYYRHGDYRYNDRLIVVRDRYGRPAYYRQVPRYYADHRYDNRRYDRDHRRVKCNKHGKCKVSYYDPRYDRDRYHHDRYDDRRYYSYDRRDRDDRRRDRRWRDHDDD